MSERMVPYELWVTSGTREYPLLLMVDELDLSDTAAKNAAVALLEAAIEKINDPSPDTIEVRRGIISPVQLHLRLWRLENELEGE